MIKLYFYKYFEGTLPMKNFKISYLKFEDHKLNLENLPHFYVNDVKEKQYLGNYLETLSIAILMIIIHCHCLLNTLKLLITSIYL